MPFIVFYKVLEKIKQNYSLTSNLATVKVLFISPNWLEASTSMRSLKRFIGHPWCFFCVLIFFSLFYFYFFLFLRISVFMGLYGIKHESFSYSWSHSNCHGKLALGMFFSYNFARFTSKIRILMTWLVTIKKKLIKTFSSGFYVRL